MILSIVLVIIWLIVVIAVSLFLQGAEGCSGDCYQGRRPCNCKKGEKRHGN